MVSLRTAHIEDFWRLTFRRNYSAAINEITFRQGKIFDGMSVQLATGINAFVGRNGVGKSNLIRSLYNVFVADESNRRAFQIPLLADSEIDVSLNLNGTQVKKTYSGLGGVFGEIAIGLMFDPCTLISEVQNLFLQQENLEELLGSFSETILSAEDLQVVNFLTHGDYVKVTVINIEDEYPNFPRLPFFMVQTRDSEYDSRNMGLGELSLLYLYWLITYMKKLEKLKILFIEEPESFLPPATQIRLGSMLAKVASENVSIVLSTHSEHILKRFPREHIQIVRKTIDGTRSFSAAHSHEPIKILGLESPKLGALLFEDQAASFFIQSCLKVSYKLSSDNFVFHKSGSEGEIQKDLNNFPVQMGEFKFYGVFDGDCRGKFSEQLKSRPNHCHLPTDQAPEHLLIAYLQDKRHLKKNATVLGISSDAVWEGLQASAGADHHDFFHEFSKAIGQPYSGIIQKLFDSWVREDENFPEVTKFVELLEKHFIT